MLQKQQRALGLIWVLLLAHDNSVTDQDTNKAHLGLELHDKLDTITTILTAHPYREEPTMDQDLKDTLDLILKKLDTIAHDNQQLKTALRDDEKADQKTKRKARAKKARK